MLTLSTLLSRIPDDIIREYILPYTYDLQSPILCNDIRNYFESTQYLQDLYKKRYIDDAIEQVSWLSNDIERFMNEDVGTMYAIMPFFHNCLTRLYSLREKTEEETK